MADWKVATMAVVKVDKRVAMKACELAEAMAAC